MKRIVVVREGDRQWFFTTVEAARLWVDTLARGLGVGTHQFTITEHEVVA